MRLNLIKIICAREIISNDNQESIMQMLAYNTPLKRFMYHILLKVRIISYVRW